MNHNASFSKNQRTIKSFVLRQGRITPSQSKALQLYWKKYGIDDELSLLNFESLFQRSANTILEIGFGMGQSLLEQAKQSPEINFLGIEIHKPGVGSLLNALEMEGINNVRIFCADAVTILEHTISDESLDKIQIFFPDPWPKKRHHKRRLIQTPFVNQIANKLKPHGILHLATDWEDYAECSLKIITETKRFIKIDQEHNRPKTKFEKRGENLGHGIWDLLFQKIS